jgi:type I restriction enzyme S subunit
MEMLDIEVFEGGFKETELGPLPEEWEVVRLGEVAEISSGGSAPQGKEYFGGKNPFIRVQHVDNDNYTIKGCDYITDEAVRKYKLKLFPKGTIIFPKSGASIYSEKRAKLPFDAYIVSHLMAVISRSPLLLQDYLFFNLISKKLSKNKADNYPTLNISEVSQIPIPLPPLEEQKAIAGILSTVQSAIEKTEKVINALKNLKKSMMKHLFTYGPVAEEEAEKVELKETEIGLIPKHWEVVRLGEVAEIIMGQSPPGETYNTQGVGMPFLQGKAEFGKVYPSPVKYTTNPLKIGKTGSVLISVRAPVGDVNIANMDYCIGRGLASISFKNGYGYNEYLFYCLQFLKPLLEKEGYGSTFKAINKEVLTKFQIPLPPLEEQQKIAQILQSIDQRIEKEEKYKNALQNLFKSLLHNLMTGKIRVRVKDHGED